MCVITTIARQIFPFTVQSLQFKSIFLTSISPQRMCCSQGCFSVGYRMRLSAYVCLHMSYKHYCTAFQHFLCICLCTVMCFKYVRSFTLRTNAESKRKYFSIVITFVAWVFGNLWQLRTYSPRTTEILLYYKQLNRHYKYYYQNITFMYKWPTLNNTI